MTMKNRQIKPVGFRVLVKLKHIEDQELEKKSESGVILEVRTPKRLELEQQATQEAYVVDIGPTAFQAFDDGEQWAKKGDCVLIAKYSGQDLHDVEEDEIYRVINDQDIMAVFPEEQIEV